MANCIYCRATFRVHLAVVAFSHFLSLCNDSKSLVHIAKNNSQWVLVSTKALSNILFIIFIEFICAAKMWRKSVIFADYVVLLASLGADLQLALVQFAAD